MNFYFALNVEFDSENVAKVISNLDPHKAHLHNMLSIPILKLYCKSNYKLLQ